MRNMAAGKHTAPNCPGNKSSHNPYWNSHIQGTRGQSFYALLPDSHHNLIDSPSFSSTTFLLLYKLQTT